MLHPRRRDEIQRAKNVTSNADTEDGALTPGLMKLHSTSTKRNLEDAEMMKDIDYFDPLDVDVREQDNTSDLE
jgi:hypothetical protein